LPAILNPCLKYNVTFQCPIELPKCFGWDVIKNAETINPLVEEIVSELPMDEKVKIARLDEDDVELLRCVFDVCVRNTVGDDFEIE
jgi:hypothetical protein